MAASATVVFGGAGFVGLNIVEAILTRGEDVVVIDATPLPAAAVAAFGRLPGKLRVVVADVRKPDEVKAAMPDRPRAVIYGAAVTAGTERDRAEPERIFDVNLNGYLSALKAAREAGAGRVINLSSAGAYGVAAFESQCAALDETVPVDPVSLYSITKFASERMTARMADVWGMDAVSVRLSGVFGRWERKTSVRDTPSPMFQLMMAAENNETALLPRRDARDWIYAPDVARALLMLRDADRLAHPLYNISTGSTYAVLDWGEALAKVRPGFVCRLVREGETPTIDFHNPNDRKPLAVGRIAAEIGFSAAFDLARSVEDYEAWVRQSGSPAMAVL